MTGSDQANPDDRIAAGRDVVIGTVVAVVAAAVLVFLIPAQTNTVSSGNDVAPSFIPQLSAWIILVLSCLLVGHRLWSMRPVWGHGASRRFAFEIALLSGAAALTWFSLTIAGFLVTAAMLICAGGLLARQRPLWRLVPLAILFPLLVDFGAWKIFFVDLP